VIALLEQCQRPEMWRRPVEYDEEQRPRREIQPARYRRVTHQWRNCTRRAANHDVLRRPPLEPVRVEKYVAIKTEQRERSGEHVRVSREQDRRRRRKQ